MRANPDLLDLPLTSPADAGKMGECARYARGLIALVVYCLHNEVLDSGRFAPSSSDAAHALELAEALCVHIEAVAHELAE